MDFVNNWSRPITLAAGATSLALDLPDGSYRLSLTDSPASPTAWEIVGAVVASGTATLTRGMEGTADQSWSSGSVIYCSVTAGVLADLLAQISSLQAGKADATAVDASISSLDGRVTTLELAAQLQPQPGETGPASFSVTSGSNENQVGYSSASSIGSISPASVTVDGYTITPIFIMYSFGYLGLKLSTAITGLTSVRVLIEGIGEYVLPFDAGATVGEVELPQSPLISGATNQVHLFFAIS